MPSDRLAGSADAPAGESGQPFSPGSGPASIADQPWFPASPPVPAPLTGGEPPSVLRPDDLDRPWHLDFHYPEGVVPLGTSLVADLVDGGQRAARELRLPESGGLAARYVGPYVYLGIAPAAPITPQDRTRALDEVRRYPDVFREQWRTASAALEAELHALRRTDLTGAEPAAIGGYLERSRRVHAEAWRIHFAVIYRLLACHELLRDALREAGVDEHTLTALLHTEDNRVLVADRALHALARRAHEDGLGRLFHQSDEPVLPRLEREPAAAGWLAAFRAFLTEHGHRSDAIGDLTMPSWEENPERVLSLMRTIMSDGYRPSRTTGEARSDGALPAGLRLDAATRALVEQARQANIVWWNEEHNLVIDLRAHLPIRAAALALAAATGAPTPDAVLYLFPDEADRLAGGTAGWDDLAEVATARRDYHQVWRERRKDLPLFAGTAAGRLHDPVISEIISADRRTETAHSPSVLRGLGVSPGVARGRVRVVRSPEGLSALRPGEVLVCEATSPSWTPVFGLLAACVCDSGGMLTHAAAISREYGIPCVCDVRLACHELRDGDEVEVDGIRGTVTLLESGPPSGGSPTSALLRRGPIPPPPEGGGFLGGSR